MEDQLQHYGVLGMKWGRRKGSSGASSGGKKKKANKGKLHFDPNKKVNGQTLAEKSLSSIATMTLTSTGSTFLAMTGHKKAAEVLGIVGTAHVVKGTVTDLALRVERRK